jgi:hypothetical protein
MNGPNGVATRLAAGRCARGDGKQFTKERGKTNGEIMQLFISPRFANDVGMNLLPWNLPR